MMAERARETEAALWQQAGIVPGATVADVGCGPAAMSVAMAGAVGPSGRVIGVDRDEPSLAMARRLVAEAGVDNVELRAGVATDTGLDAGAVDVAVARHVLAHNGPDEQRIVSHLADLVLPGGCVYLVDIDGTAMRVLDADPVLDDLSERYVEFHRRRGNDLMVGLRLARLLETAGLQVEVHQGTYQIVSAPVGLRPPPWAARDAMLADGVVSTDDLARWEAAFERTDRAERRPTLFVSTFIALGRKGG
jgi:2-polyprenyl-3-methyl-5-hydroxy-6-metoxy-1,4-benzoquinol methylase